LSIGLWFGASTLSADTVTAVSSTQPATTSPSATSLPAAQLLTASNANVVSVTAAKGAQPHPERLTPIARPHHFDLQAYTLNPHTYLDTVEPGRVWDVAQAGPGITSIRPQPPIAQLIQPLGTAKLSVIAAPNMPVTFVSYGLGAFDNQLTSITVQADASGVASVTFTAIKGTTGNVDILAACPRNTGQAKFHLDVAVPAAVQSK
jgi:hypothetical protein